MFENNVSGTKIAHTRRPEIELVNTPLLTLRANILPISFSQIGLKFFPFKVSNTVSGIFTLP